MSLVMQKQVDEAGNETLSPSDKLYVVHVKQGKDQKERAWSAGGPLLPSLDMALARYPHTIIELEVLFISAHLARSPVFELPFSLETLLQSACTPP